MIERSMAAFDELKQGIKTIEALADPEVGELWIGCPESISASLLPPIVEEFAMRYPRVVIHVRRSSAPSLDLPALRERRLDFVLVRIAKPLGTEGEDLKIERLFDDRLVVVAGAQSPLAHRRKVSLADLAAEPWVLTPSDCWTNMVLAEAFEAHGLGPPRVSLTTYSLPLRTNLVATGRFLTVFPTFAMPRDASRHALKVLPVELPHCAWPFGVVMLKNRMLSPVAERFLEHVRGFTRVLAAREALERQSA